MLVVLGFVSILLLVIAHEAGHFFAARKSGIEVEEFGVGFPPKVYTYMKRKGTEFTINLLPLGGFVKLKGEHDADTTPGSFGAARLRDKVKVMLAGVAVNLAIAYVLFTIIALLGMPKLIPNQFSIPSDTKISQHDVLVAVSESSPAGKAGLQDGDVIRSLRQVSCNDECLEIPIKTEGDISDGTERLAGEQVIVSYERGGEPNEVSVLFNSQAFVDQNKQEADACYADESIPVENCPEYQGYFGVIPQDYIVRQSTWSAPIVGAGVTVQFTKATMQGLGQIVGSLLQGDTEPARQQATGVLGIGFILSSASFLGVVYTLMIVAVISLTLAIMNVLPIPALDGGRLFVTLVYRLFNRDLTQKAEERIHGTGFAVLMVLFVLITILDVQRFIL